MFNINTLAIITCELILFTSAKLYISKWCTTISTRIINNPTRSIQSNILNFVNLNRIFLNFIMNKNMNRMNVHLRNFLIKTKKTFHLKSTFLRPKSNVVSRAEIVAMLLLSFLEYQTHFSIS